MGALNVEGIGMETVTGKRSVTILRWLARILSIASIVILLLFLFGEGDFSEIGAITVREWLLVLCFPGGVVLGMIIGWWREGIGGALTAGSLLIFYGATLGLYGSLPSGPWFLLFALPGLLFLACWLLSRGGHQSAAAHA
jgi:hypothetical protein